MAKTRRHFTPEDKYSILQEAEREGTTEVMKQGAMDLSSPDCEDMSAGSALYSLDKCSEPVYLCLTGGRNNEESVANLFEKSVQIIGG